MDFIYLLTVTYAYLDTEKEFHTYEEKISCYKTLARVREAQEKLTCEKRTARFYKKYEGNLIDSWTSIEYVDVNADIDK